MRLLHVISHPVQYFVPLYRLLHKQEDFEFMVFYERGPGNYYDKEFCRHVDWETDTACNYHWEIVSTSNLADAFRRYCPTHVWLHGYATMRQLYTFWLAKQYGCKVWLRGESSLPTHPFKSVVLRWLFKHVDAFLAIGSANRMFYLEHGVTDQKIVWCPYAVDNEWWADGHRTDERQTVAYIGKMLPHKRAQDIYQALRDINVNFIVTETFVDQKTVRYIYHNADALVLPSSFEPWGIVVNEAMACGLPVVASDQVRAANDLVIPHITGMTYPCGDIPALRKAIKYVLDHRYTMGQNARNHVQAFSYQADLEGIRKAMAL